MIPSSLEHHMPSAFRSSDSRNCAVSDVQALGVREVANQPMAVVLHTSFASMELLAIALILTLSIGLCAIGARLTLETVFSLMLRSPARLHATQRR